MLSENTRLTTRYKTVQAVRETNEMHGLMEMTDHEDIETNSMSDIMSLSNAEEKAIVDMEGMEEMEEEMGVELDRLLFSSNSSAPLNLDKQSTSSIKKYFEDRESTKDEYSGGYINFYKLHCLLIRIKKNKPKSRNAFIENLDREWTKYEKFAERASLNISKMPVSKNLMMEILRFNEFIWVNQEHLNHLIKKHDKISAESNKLRSIWDWKLKYYPQSSLFPKIKQISNLYDFDRSALSQNTKNNIDNFGFERENIKFWLRRSDICQVIGVIIQHLPIYVFSDKSKKSKNEIINQQISSVYFDNDAFECYHERIQKLDFAKSLRIRWYGKDAPKRSDSVFFERKVHRCGKPSKKDRFKLKSKDVLSFIESDKTLINKSDLHHEVHEMVKTLCLAPKTRTVYKRIAFQFKNTNSLRISLDLDLKFVKENGDLLANNEWYTKWDNICNDDVVDYPLCVLEIKLSQQYVSNPPQWIEDLMDSNLLIQCHKFSKYGESVNQFYQNKISIIPKWRLLNEDHDEVPDENLNAFVNYKSESDVVVEEEDERKINCCLPLRSFIKDWKKKAKNKRTAVNPKVYFSNERTFLGWFQAAVFIGSAGLTIRSMNQKDPAGHLMISVAGLVLLWAVCIYYKRNFKLLAGGTDGLHDLYGPAFLVSVIIFVFIYSLIMESSFIDD